MFLYIAFQVQNKKSNLFLGINGFLETQISFTKIADSKSSRVLTKEATFQHRWSNVLNIHFPREETHGSFCTLPMSPPSVIYIAQLIHNSQRSCYTIAIEKARHERRCQQMVSKGCIWKPGIQNAGNKLNPAEGGQNLPPCHKGGRPSRFSAREWGLGQSLSKSTRDGELLDHSVCRADSQDTHLSARKGQG